MHIIKMLGPIEEVETQMALLYEKYSRLFRENRAAASFFASVNLEETVHVNIVRFQRRLVSKNMKAFAEIDFDLNEIEKTIADIEAARRPSSIPTLAEALELSIMLEESLAESHFLSAINSSNPEVETLFRGLGTADKRHTKQFLSFASGLGLNEIAGHKLDMGQTLASTQIPIPADNLEPPVRRTVSSETMERIDYLYTWHKTMDFYKFLGIREYANEAQIKQAYMRMIQTYHPDRFFGVEAEITLKLESITRYAIDAYTTLTDKGKRQEYNSTVASARRH